MAVIGSSTGDRFFYIWEVRSWAHSLVPLDSTMPDLGTPAIVCASYIQGANRWIPQLFFVQLELGLVQDVPGRMHSVFVFPELRFHVEHLAQRELTA